MIGVDEPVLDVVVEGAAGAAGAGAPMPEQPEADADSAEPKKAKGKVVDAEVVED